ncbi:MAG: cytochrome c oxidase assembly protein [Acidimicrobiia bacterium]
MIAASVPAFNLHADVILVVGAIAIGYVTALVRLGPELAGPGASVATGFQKTCFGLGVLAIYVASAWPIHDVAEGSMYSVHMVQHLGYTMVAAPLLLLGTPAWLARWVLRPRWLFRTVRTMSRFVPAIVTFNVVIVLTHWPAFVDLTLRSAVVHFLAHTVLLLSAFLIWMPILSPLPEIPRLGPISRMVFLFLQTIVPTVPASFLTFGDHPLYRRYETLPKLWGLTALDDQLIAGLIMKIGAGLLLMTLIAVIFFRWVATEEPMPRRRVSGVPAVPELTEVKV